MPWKLCPNFRLQIKETSIEVLDRETEELLVELCKSDPYHYEAILVLMNKAYQMGMKVGWKKKEEALRSLLGL